MYFNSKLQSNILPQSVSTLKTYYRKANSRKEGRDVRMGDIAGDYNMTLPRGEKELSGRKIGQIVRRTFGIKTIRKSVGYIVDVQSYNKRIAKLRKKYNFPEEDEQMNEVNFSQGDEILDQL